MRSIPRFPTLALVLALSAGAGCGEDASVEETDPRTAKAAARSPYGVPASEGIRVVPVEVEVPDLPAGWNGARVVALSDFQIGLWPDNADVAAAAVRTAIRLKPDVVVLVGDYVVRGGQAELAALARVLAPLRGRMVVAVLGDRDQRDREEMGGGEVDSTAARVVQTLNRAGVIVVQNERARLVRAGDTAYVAGIGPYVARRPAWRQAEIFASIPRSGSTPILLSHMPAGVYAAPDSTYPLVIAGSTFCGRVEVPGAARLSWVNTELFPNPASRIQGTDRLYRIDGNGLFITCGTGYSFVPVRLGAPPEVALITLRGAAGREAAADTVRQPNLDSLIQEYERTPDTTAVVEDTAGGT
ncbi:MAG: hypothetical protein M3483_05205 [Gemmatimonadota bacterium]|nr:hypothetical protein [Gemmatimonadota bacterium]